ncbi:MAG: dihydrolipoamide acetyltransferase family protein, partial [Chloroflexota bacterium]
RLAREASLDLAQLRGSGPEGRVQETDVRTHLENKPSAVEIKPVSTTPASGRTLRTIPFTGMRKTIAMNMARSAQTIPAIQLEIDVDMLQALALHEQAKKAAGEKKVSLTAVIVKAAAWTLSRNPILNSRLGENEISLLPEINIGIAVSIENGLIVPVIHDADQKGILQLAEEINDISARARQNKLRAYDLEGATFTISNLGMFGIDRFTAIINPPQVGILAVSASKKQFLANELNQPVLHTLMNMRLSADHRVVDGVEAARFLSDLRKGMETPGEMLL